MRVVSAGDGYASQFSRVAHFGLGENEVIEELEVLWPNGKKQIFEGILADQMIEIDEDITKVRVIEARKATSSPSDR